MTVLVNPFPRHHTLPWPPKAANAGSLPNDFVDEPTVGTGRTLAKSGPVIDMPNPLAVAKNFVANLDDASAATTKAYDLVNPYTSGDQKLPVSGVRSQGENPGAGARPYALEALTSLERALGMDTRVLPQQAVTAAGNARQDLLDGVAAIDDSRLPVGAQHFDGARNWIMTARNVVSTMMGA